MNALNAIKNYIEALETFRSAYPNEYHWLLKNYGSFKLAKGIYDYMIYQGRITHKQLNAIKKVYLFWLILLAL
jgi:hypothetical protein